MKAHRNDSDIDQIRDHLDHRANEVRPSNPLATIIKAAVALAPIYGGH